VIGINKSAAATSDPAGSLLRVGKVYPSFCFLDATQHILIGSPQAIAEKFRRPAIGPSTTWSG
jgi:hypothetical protein